MSDILLIYPNMHLKCRLTIESQHLLCSSFVYSFKRNEYITYSLCEALKRCNNILYNNNTHNERMSVCIHVILSFDKNVFEFNIKQGKKICFNRFICKGIFEEKNRLEDFKK